MAPRSAVFAFEIATKSLATKSLDGVVARLSSLDANTGVLVAGDGIVASVVLGRLPSGLPTPARAIGGSLVLLSLACGVASFAIRSYRLSPSARVVADLADRPEDGLKWALVASLLDAIDENQSRVRLKAAMLTSAQASLLAALVTLAAYLIWSSVVGG